MKLINIFATMLILVFLICTGCLTQSQYDTNVGNVVAVKHYDNVSSTTMPRYYYYEHFESYPFQTRPYYHFYGPRYFSGHKHYVREKW